MPRSAYQSLTLHQKMDLISKSHNTSMKQLAQDFGIGRSTVHNILKNKAEFISQYENHCPGDMKRRSSCRFSEVDDHIWNLFQDLRACNIEVTGPMLREKALEFASLNGIDGFRASDGWLQRFRVRHNITAGKSDGSGTSAGLQMIDVHEPCSLEIQDVDVNNEVDPLTMSNVLEMDEESDVESLEVPTEASSSHKIGSQVEHLRNMKRELDFRGTLLGKTWNELSQLLGKYQSELVTKFDHVESMLGSDGREQIIYLENTLDTKNQQIEEFQKTIHDLETKLLEKDGEIVHLRTDVHKLRNEVSIKDNLINKLQTQMAKESMEYSTEISTLKEIISVGESAMASLDSSAEIPVPSKRRKKAVPVNLSQQRAETVVHAVELSPITLPVQPPQESMPSPSSRLWRSMKTQSKTHDEKPPTDLMVKEEPEDIMSALEQSPAEGTSEPKSGQRKGQKVWKMNMTSEERQAYNKATAERMRRYRERQKLKRLLNYQFPAPVTTSYPETIRNSKKLESIIAKLPNIAPKQSVTSPSADTQFSSTYIPSEGVIATGVGQNLQMLQFEESPLGLSAEHERFEIRDQNLNITSMGDGSKVYFP